jgi:hypothetical protein
MAANFAKLPELLRREDDSAFQGWGGNMMDTQLLKS